MFLRFLSGRARRKNRRPSRAKLPAFEPLVVQLEDRTLLSLPPAGPEFLVNAAIDGFQGEPAVAMDDDGDFVVAWSDGLSVFDRRFNLAAAPQGGDQQVSTSTAADDEHTTPAVAMDADGDFVVSWGRYNYRGEYNYEYDVFARRFDAAGTALESQTRVNRTTSGDDLSSAVAMDADGDYAIAWERYDYSANATEYDVFARQFDAAGQAQPNEFRVNTSVGQDAFRGEAAIAMAPSGDFVVVWSGAGAGDDEGVFGRLYNSAGQAQAAEFPVNNTIAGVQSEPEVAMDSAGNFVVVWSGDGVGDADGVFARLFNAAGQPLGDEFLVNATSGGLQSQPAVARDDTGNFVVTWSGPGAGDADGVFARAYNAAGQDQGGEVLVNTTTAGFQSASAVAMSAAGDVVVVWSGNGTGDTDGVFARLFPVPPTVNVVASDPIAHEIGPDTAEFTISRSGSSAASLSIQATISGTAMTGLDYTLIGIFTIPAGSATTTIIVVPQSDGFTEDPESVVITLDLDAAYTIGASASATATITDVDNIGPTIDKLELVPGKKNKIASIILTFSEDLNPSDAENIGNYSLSRATRKGAKPVALSPPTYSARTVTLTPLKPLSVKKLSSYTLTVHGDMTLIDLHDNLLDGDANFSPGGNYEHSLADGTLRSASRRAILSVVDELLASGRFPNGLHAKSRRFSATDP